MNSHFLRHQRAASQTKGYAVVTTFVFVSLGFLISAGIIAWSSQSARVTDRNLTFEVTHLASEAAGDTIGARVYSDFKNNPISYVRGQLTSYTSVLPITGAIPLLKNGLKDTQVQCTTSSTYGIVPGTSPNLFGYYDTLTIRTTATNTLASKPLAVSAEQNIRLADLPLFQFQFFYHPDLEIGFSGGFTATGLIHSNQKIFLHPSGSLTFQSSITTPSLVLEQKSPLNPELYSPGTISYRARREAKHRVLGFRTGKTLSVTNLRDMVEPPPVLPSMTALSGSNNFRYYNKADLIIRVTPTLVVATSGAYNNYLPLVAGLPSGPISQARFWDRREGRWMNCTQLDIAQLGTNFSTLRSQLGRFPNTIYIIDERIPGNDEIAAVRLVNGQTLPQGGLTLASPHPVYILGNYNAPSQHLGTTNTSAALPASIIADAITILSREWNARTPLSDTQSVAPIQFHRAGATTVNAALITGIVPSNGTDYSGGVENSIRLLEDWGDTLLHFNGSIAVLYYSKYAIAPWSGIKQTYSAPIRQWTWDRNLAMAEKQPPGAPMLRLPSANPGSERRPLYENAVSHILRRCVLFLPGPASAQCSSGANRARMGHKFRRRFGHEIHDDSCRQKALLYSRSRLEYGHQLCRTKDYFLGSRL